MTILQNQLAPIKYVRNGQQCHTTGFSHGQSRDGLILIKLNFIFWIRICVADINVLNSALKTENPQRMESKKHGYCWLKELSLAHSEHVCFKRFLLTACLSNCQDKTFLLLFHFRRGKMEAKVLTLT